MLEPKANPDGTVTTQIQDVLKPVSDGIKAAAPILNTLFPGAGLIGTGLALFLSLVGNGITSVMVKRRGTALGTIIQGVEVGTQKYNELVESIVGIVKGINPEMADKIRQEANKYKTVKELVAEISRIVGNEKFMDAFVQSITRKAA